MKTSRSLIGKKEKFALKKIFHFRIEAGMFWIQVTQILTAGI